MLSDETGFQIYNRYGQFFYEVECINSTVDFKINIHLNHCRM